MSKWGTVEYRARATDPQTSHDGAASMTDTKSGAYVEGEIVRVMRKHPEGLTSLEIADITNIPRVTVSPSLRPMARDGVLVATTERRMTRTGRRGIVWKLAPRSEH